MRLSESIGTIIFDYIRCINLRLYIFIRDGIFLEYMVISSYFTACVSIDYNLLCPSRENCLPSHPPMMRLTFSGSSVNAQCDVLTWSNVMLGTYFCIDLPIEGGRARSLRAWMKSSGTSMFGWETYCFSSVWLISVRRYQFSGPLTPWRVYSFA